MPMKYASSCDGVRNCVRKNCAYSVTEELVWVSNAKGDTVIGAGPGEPFAEETELCCGARLDRCVVVVLGWLPEKLAKAPRHVGRSPPSSGGPIFYALSSPPPGSKQDVRH
eukprot:scaffold2540_cov197-Alexandrium_tamarense.AAC.6